LKPGDLQNIFSAAAEFDFLGQLEGGDVDRAEPDSGAKVQHGATGRPSKPSQKVSSGSRCELNDYYVRCSNLPT